ncbi:nucleotidyltransferase domain-containing protein [Bacillus sp. EAC]|uniref:nucleotidyltransferase domain-containing protein n=1 Tax=Bacillus sp. EAC TaxID=1978338 RepID=UPI000B43E427|nr:nucleotidyltransferase domain-containing protein [Bacillus sp. EAC]
MKMAPREAAIKFIESEFPSCLGAILSGSVIRGDYTETSDLDLIIIENRPNAYRESLIKFDWKIEVFVYDHISYKSFFESDIKRARPSIIRMIAEGITLKNHPILENIIIEAKQLLKSGPDKWDEQTVASKHYFLSDVFEDFIGSTNKYELICIANTLLERLAEFILRTNNCWIGSSKWIYRELAEFDRVLTDEIFSAFHIFYESGDKKEVINLIDSILKPFGGKLFEGFKVGD